MGCRGRRKHYHSSLPRVLRLATNSAKLLNRVLEVYYIEDSRYGKLFYYRDATIGSKNVVRCIIP